MTHTENLVHYDEQYIGHRSRWRVAYYHLAAAIERFLGIGSIVDMGCAAGFLVEFCRVRGFEAYGVDISPDAQTFWPKEHLTYYTIGDISDNQLNFVPTRYVSCMEVAEHLRKDQSGALVANLVKHHPEAVLFTAAPLGASKDPTHQNEQPYQYWIEHFSSDSYQIEPGLSCAFRVYLRQHGGIPYWYIRNLMVFVPNGTSSYTFDIDYQAEEQRFLEMEYLMLSQLRELSVENHLHHIEEIHELYRPKVLHAADCMFTVDENGFILIKG
ncbi:MAG: class I SAM-dependent methyltransferase [Arenicellales bacterium]